MTNIFKSIILAAFSIIFVASTFISIFNAGQAINQGLRLTFHLLPDRCDIRVTNPTDKGSVEPTQCYPDARDAKMAIIEALSLLLISLPVAIFFWKQMKKAYNDQF